MASTPSSSNGVDKAALGSPEMPIPYNNSKNRGSIYREAGVMSVPIYRGYVYSDEKNSEVKGSKKWATFKDVAVNINIVSTGIRYFLNLLSSADWKFEPAGTDGQSIELAEFAEDVFTNMHSPLSRVSRRVGMYRFHGYGIHEWTAIKRPDGRIGFKDLEVRETKTIERWDITPSGEILGVYQISPQTSRELWIPRWKFLYMVDDTFTDSPEGMGILRNLIEPVKRFKRLLDLEVKGFERDLRGIPVAKAPLADIRKQVDDGVISGETAENLINSLKNFVQLQVKDEDTGIIIDSDPYRSQGIDGQIVSQKEKWGIELLTGESHGLSDLGNTIERITREMARIMGVEHLLLGEATGNRALSEDKSKNFYLVVNSVLSDIKSQFKRDLLDTLWVLNGLPDDKKPILKVEEVSFRSVEEVGRTLRDLALAGATLKPEDSAVDDIRELVGLSRRTQEEIPDPEEEMRLESELKNPAKPGEAREVNQGEGPQGEA